MVTESARRGVGAVDIEKALVRVKILRSARSTSRKELMVDCSGTNYIDASEVINKKKKKMRESDQLIVSSV